MSKTTITTNGGNTVTGTEVRRSDGPMDFGRAVLAVATGGVSEMTQDQRVTVRDGGGHYWTGKEQ